MQEVITVATMRESDAHTIAEYVPSRTLMRRAAMGVFQAARWEGPVGILTGGGNNGGRRLRPGRDPGRPRHPLRHLPGVGDYVYLFRTGSSTTTRRWRRGCPATPIPRRPTCPGCKMLVDCLLGTGFSGSVRGLYRQASPGHEPVQGLRGQRGHQQRHERGHRPGEPGGAVRPHGDHRLPENRLLLGSAVWQWKQLAVADIGIRLIREDYHLAAPEEVVFPKHRLLPHRPHRRA